MRNSLKNSLTRCMMALTDITTIHKLYFETYDLTDTTDHRYYLCKAELAKIRQEYTHHLNIVISELKNESVSDEEIVALLPCLFDVCVQMTEDESNKIETCILTEESVIMDNH